MRIDHPLIFTIFALLRFEEKSIIHSTAYIACITHFGYSRVVVLSKVQGKARSQAIAH